MSPIINFSVLQSVLNGPNSLVFLATIGAILLFALVHSILSDHRASASRRRGSEPARWSDNRPSGHIRRHPEQRHAS
jgi:hypothetical protein